MRAAPLPCMHAVAACHDGLQGGVSTCAVCVATRGVSVALHTCILGVAAGTHALFP